MRAVIIATLCMLGCAPTVSAPPDYTFARYAPEKPRSPTTSVLVLMTAGTEREKSAAFLAGFCNWMRATPTIAETYGAVYLLPSVEGDLLGEASESIAELVNAKGSENANVAKTEASIREFLKERAAQYRCGGAGVVEEFLDVTVLQVAYGKLEPYGIGLRYLAAELTTSVVPKPGSKSNNKAVTEASTNTRRGFFELRDGDLVGDARRFAALLLSDPGEAISIAASVRTPPESRCLGVEGELCIYQPSTIRIEFELQDSPFVPAKDVIPLTLDSWAVIRDGKPDSDSARLSLVKGAPSAVDFHPRRTGTYKLVASFGARDLPLRRTYELVVRVEPAALMFGGGFRFRYLMGRLLRDLNWRPPSGSPSIDVEIACLTTFVLCRDPDVVTLQATVENRLSTYRVIAAKQIQTWAAAIRAKLVPPPSEDQPAGWRTAIEAAIGDDEVRDGIRRMQDYGERSDRWCDAVAASSRALFQQQTGASISRPQSLRWVEKCVEVLEAIDKERQAICPTTRSTPATSMSAWTIGMPRVSDRCKVARFATSRRGTVNWLHVDEGLTITLSKDTWLHHNADPRAVDGVFQATLVAVDDDGVPTEPIDLAIEDEGRANSVRAFGYLGLYRNDANHLSRGLHATASLWETFNPFFELEQADALRWRVGLGIAPFCFSEELRTTFCRSLMGEIEYAATFGEGGYQASTFGLRFSLWRHGLAGFGLTYWLRASFANSEVTTGVGAGFGL